MPKRDTIRIKTIAPMVIGGMASFKVQVEKIKKMPFVT